MIKIYGRQKRKDFHLKNYFRKNYFLMKNIYHLG